MWLRRPNGRFDPARLHDGVPVELRANTALRGLPGNQTNHPRRLCRSTGGMREATTQQ